MYHDRFFELQTCRGSKVGDKSRQIPFSDHCFICQVKFDALAAVFLPVKIETS